MNLTELTVQNDCLMWGIRVIVPPALREKVLEELHSGHSGMSRMKSLARCHVWWPCLDKEVEEVCKSCRPCLKSQVVNTPHPSPPTAPLHHSTHGFGPIVLGKEYM